MSKEFDILIVDDDDMARFLVHKSVEKIAKNSGFSCRLYEAEDGIDAVIKCNEMDFDLIFMDIRMPKMDGFDATKQILAEKPNSKVITITAEPIDLARKRGIDMGMLDVIPKPLKRYDILESLIKAGVVEA
jgi:CheY-like chemotaxis protein